VVANSNPTTTNPKIVHLITFISQTWTYHCKPRNWTTSLQTHKSNPKISFSSNRWNPILFNLNTANPSLLLTRFTPVSTLNFLFDCKSKTLLIHMFVICKP
jgi:hypothetical protein